MKKYVLFCDKCGKQIQGAASTINIGENAYDFCETCSKKLKTLITSFVNAPDIHADGSEVPEERMPRKKVKAEIDMPKVFALRKAGWKWIDIGKEFGVTDSTIINHVRKWQEEHHREDTEDDTI